MVNIESDAFEMTWRSLHDVGQFNCADSGSRSPCSQNAFCPYHARIAYKNGRTDIVIYAESGFERFFVRPDGEVVYSADHGRRNHRLAILVGFTSTSSE